MPAPASRFKDKLITFFLGSHDGQFAYPESGGGGFPTSGNVGGGGNFKENAYGTFSFCTGGANGMLSDIGAPSASSTQTLIDPRRCPLNMRPYLTRLDVAVNGTVPWLSSSPTWVPYLSVQDTLGTPLVHIPWSALKGNAALTFPDSDCVAPLLLGPSAVTTTFGAPVETFTYSASAGTITVATDLFSGLTSETQMVGTPVEIVGGTGLGQTAIITACAAGVMTLNVNWGSYGTAAPNSSSAYGTVAPDTTTSVIAIYWQPIKTVTSSTVIVLPNAAGTPYTANVFDNGFNLLAVGGQLQGTSRSIVASTTGGQLTLNAATNGSGFSATTTLVMITNEPNMDGSIDMVCDDKLACAQLNTGIQVVCSAAGGTVSTTAGSVPSVVRLYGEGYWAA